MAKEAKTKPTSVSFGEFLATAVDPARHDDCRALAAMMQKATGEVLRDPADLLLGQRCGLGEREDEHASIVSPSPSWRPSASSASGSNHTRLSAVPWGSALTDVEEGRSVTVSRRFAGYE